MTEEELLKTLANRTNQGILGLLAVEPTYPRKIGGLLSLAETEVARRLRHMEGLGLVEGTWSHVGKNVKIYRLIVAGVSLRFQPAGIELQITPKDERPTTAITLNPFEETLPSAVDCIGRDAETATLAGPEPVVIVDGMLGIGKTTFVARFAHEQAKQRAVLWHSFRSVESLNWLANRLGVFLAQHGNRTLLDAFEKGAELGDKRELMLRAMNDPRFLFVFDDIHLIQDQAVGSFLSDVIDRIDKGKVLIVGRESPRFRPAPGRVRSLHVTGLQDEEVGRFLERKDVKVPPSLLPKIREEVGGHPLALNLLLEAARERAVPIQELLDRIPEKNLEEWLLQEVYSGLAEDEKKVLSLASLYRTRFTLDDVAPLSEASLEAPLLRLRRRLLVQAFEGEYALHEIVRNFFYALLQDKPRLHLKVAGRYLAEGTVEGRLEAMHHFLAAGRKDRVLDLLEENIDLQDFDYIDGGYHNLYLGILDMFQRQEVGTDRRWALILDEKGDIHFHRKEYERALAHYAEAAGLFQPAKDRERLADLAWKRALCFVRLDRAKDAVPLVDAGLKLTAGDGLSRKRLLELQAQIAPTKTDKPAKALKAMAGAPAVRKK